MVDELVADGRPGAALDGGPPGGAVGRSQRRIGGERPTASRTATSSRGGTSSPVRPCATRSSGPPAAGATTGTPLAMASWTV
ncbi:hypothetical protein O1M63_54835 [Streptomyces mirabilis]|nr:hypothetical protein [Streptomyces mirabilis]